MQELGVRSIIRAKRHYFSAQQAMKSDGRIAPNLLNRDYNKLKLLFNFIMKNA